MGNTISINSNARSLASAADAAGLAAVVSRLVLEHEIDAGTAVELDVDDISELTEKRLERKKMIAALKKLKLSLDASGEGGQDGDALDASTLSILNQPGFWDFMISHTQRNGKAVALAERLAASLRKLGFTVWLDVDMGKKSTAAMKEGVRNSKCVIAIITGATDDGQVSNAYFSRSFCILELECAIEHGVQIQPIILDTDKSNIGVFLGQAPIHLKFLGNIDFIDLNRSDIDYWNVGVSKVKRALDDGEVLSNEMKKMYAASKLELAAVEAAKVVAAGPTSSAGETKESSSVRS